MKILLPVDASRYSADAVEEVSRRQWPRGTKVRVLAAVEIFGPPPIGPLMYDAGGNLDEFLQLAKKQAKQLTERVAKSLVASGLKTETFVREGDPRLVIVEEAESWKADLIVLGSHGRSGIKKWLLGSVAQSVVSHAPCSVEVVRGKSAKKLRKA